MVKYGELASPYTGKVFPDNFVDGYNKYTQDIERTKQPSTIEFLKDQRHRYFVMVAHMVDGRI